MYLRMTYESQYSKFAANYTNNLVEVKVEEMGRFTWDDKASEDRLRKSGVKVRARPEELLPTKVKYSGEWSQAGKKHGRGTLIWPDGARYEGYFFDDH